MRLEILTTTTEMEKKMHRNASGVQKQLKKTAQLLSSTK